MMEMASLRPKIGSNSGKSFSRDRARLAQGSKILADWLRDDLSPRKPWTPSRPGFPQSATLLWPQSWWVPTPRTFYAAFFEYGNRRRPGNTGRHAPKEIPAADELPDPVRPHALPRHSGKADSVGQSKKVRLSSHQRERSGCCRNGLSTPRKQETRSSRPRFRVKQRNAVIPHLVPVLKEHRRCVRNRNAGFRRV